MTRLKNINRYTLYFYTLVLFQIVAYLVFRHLNIAYQSWDSAGHMSLSLKFTEMYRSLFSDPDVSLYKILTTSFYYPPLLHFVMGFLILIFGKGFNVQLHFMFFLFILSLFLLKKIVLELKFDDRHAFYTVFFYSFFPFVADQARLFHTEMPMVLMILLCFLFLLRSQNLQDKKYTLLFFLVLGLGQLNRWYSALYLLVPFLYFFYQAVFVDKKFSEILPTLVIGSVISSVIFLPWYTANFRLLTIISSWYARGEIDDPQNVFGLKSLVYYLENLLSNQIFLVPLVFSIIGFFKFTKKNLKYGLLLLAHFVFIYALFTFIKNKNSRYILGLHTQLAFLVSYFVLNINGKVLLKISAVFSILAFLFLSFNQTKPYSQESRAWGILLAGPLYKSVYVDPQMYSYSPIKENIDGVLAFIQKDALNLGISPVGVVSLLDQETFSASNQELVRLKLDYRNLFFATPYFREKLFRNDYEMIKYLRDRDTSYVIVPSNGPGPQGNKNFAVLNQMITFINSFGGIWYEPIGGFELHENSVTVLRRIPKNEEFIVDTCKEVKGKDSYGVGVDPLSSAVFFVGNYSFNGINKAYDNDRMNILELNNTSLETREYHVGNLPVEGFSVCHRMGTRMKLQKEIFNSLVLDAKSCGSVPCKIVGHSKFVDGAFFAEKEYSSENFTGVGVGGVLKALKMTPYYIEEVYSLKSDIIEALGDL